MGKLFIMVMGFLFIGISFYQFIIVPLTRKSKKGVQSLEELKAKASSNFEEREAIKQEVISTEQSLQEIKSKTN